MNQTTNSPKAVEGSKEPARQNFPSRARDFRPRRPFNGDRNQNRRPQFHTQRVEEKYVPKPAIALPELEAFLNSGSHFGHKVSRWNPKMAQYIYEERNGIHIIDIVKTMKLMQDALAKIQEASDKGNVLIVGTKGQAATTIKAMAEEVGAFYIDTRWPGGLFTNFSVIHKSLDKLMKMEEKLANGAEDLVKKEQLMMQRDVARLNELYSGIKFMDRLPSLLIVIDSRVEKNAIKEAKNAGVRVVSLVDTNCDPSIIDCPIPANDDSIRSIKLFVDLFGKAVKGGRRADALIALRRDYNARLENTKATYLAEQENKRIQEENERERLKSLRQGAHTEVAPTGVIRVVSTAKTTHVEVAPKVVIKATPKVEEAEVKVVKAATKKVAATKVDAEKPAKTEVKAKAVKKAVAKK